MELIALVLAIALAVLSPQSSDIDARFAPLVSGYLRQDATISGKTAAWAGPPSDSLEMSYHVKFGRMFLVYNDPWSRMADLYHASAGDEYLWPIYKYPLEAGFYPLGRNEDGFFVGMTRSQGGGSSLAYIDNVFEFHAGLVLALWTGLTLKFRTEIFKSAGPKLNLEWYF